MRDMPAAGQDQPLRWPRNASLDRVQLCQRRIFVICSLNQEERRLDARQAILDVPVTKILTQPGIVPTGKGRGCVSMMSRQSFRQLATTKGLTGLADPFKRNLLHKDMRRDRHDPFDRALRERGEEQRNRRSIGMTDQQGPRYRQLFQELRQRQQRLLMQVVDLSRPRQRIGTTIAVARPDQQRASGRSRKLLREVTPKADRAEALMEQHHHGSVIVPARQDAIFQAMTPDRDELDVLHDSSLCEEIRSLTM